jgi:hypothetical protein
LGGCRFIGYLKQAGLFDACVADCLLALTSPHAYHTDMLSSLRLVLRVDVLPGDEYNVAHATNGLWALLDHLGPARRPALLRGDKSWGIERVMARAEQNELGYLFRLRMTANVRRSLDRAMRYLDWAIAGQGWQDKETSLRLSGWSRQRRIVFLRRTLGRTLAMTDRTNPAQPLLGFAEVGPDDQLWEYAAFHFTGQRDPHARTVVRRSGRRGKCVR